MYFGSDNQTGASEKVFATLQQANDGITGAYGDDEWTAKAVAQIQETFSIDAEVFFVSTGTAANSLALACMAHPWDSIVCHGQAHIINDELTAPEFFTSGARLIGLDSSHEKLTLESVTDFLAQGAAHPPHNAEPAVLSLTQVTESGQVYSIEEVRDFTDLAHRYGLNVHMDGARFANSVASLNCHPADISWKAGVDVLCLGATKNGALSAEAVIFFNKDLARKFVQHRKRSGHLVSKSRWLGAQMSGWLDDNHWLSLAQHANAMAARLHAGLRSCQAAKIIWPVQANEIFTVLPKEAIASLRNQGAIFYEWPQSFLPEHITINANEDVIRLVTSFRTTEAEVDRFIEVLSTSTI